MRVLIQTKISSVSLNDFENFVFKKKKKSGCGLSAAEKKFFFIVVLLFFRCADNHSNQKQKMWKRKSIDCHLFFLQRKKNVTVGYIFFSCSFFCLKSYSFLYLPSPDFCLSNKEKKLFKIRKILESAFFGDDSPRSYSKAGFKKIFLIRVFLDLFLKSLFWGKKKQIISSSYAFVFSGQR